MKVLARGTLFLLLIIQSCYRETDHDILLSEQLMSESPDSSLAILSSIDPGKISGKERKARYSLALSMALDKNYIDVDNDSTVSVAYDYYKRYGNRQKKMLSAYYLAVVHQNAGRLYDAAIEFDEALLLAKELGDNHHCGLACQHLSTIHASLYNHYLALDYSQSAAEFFDACGETLSADYARRNVAEQLIKERSYDEAITILEKIITKNDYAPLLKYAYWLKAEALAFGRHDYSGALSAIEEVSSVKPSEAMNLYGFKAVLNEAIGKHKEADALIGLAGQFVKSSIDSLTFLDQASRLFEMRGDYKNALESFSKAMDIQNRNVNLLLEQPVAHALEEHYRETLKEEQERSYRKTKVFLLSAFFVLVLLSFLVLIIRRQKMSIMQDMADIDALNKDVLSLKEKDNHFKAICDVMIQDRMQILHNLADSYFEYTYEEVKKREKNSGIETKEEIMTKFRHKLGELRSDTRLYSSLEEAVNYSIDNIIAKAKDTCGRRLKNEDYIILTLLFAGFSIKSIAFLFRMTEPALRTRKTRYKQLFRTLDEPLSSQLANALGK